MSMHTSAYFKKFSFAILLILVLNPITILEASGPVRSKHGMVVSASTIASKVGVEIMKEGGNAIDAAVAVGFA